MFAKFRELGSARQVFLWARQAACRCPSSSATVACRIEWARRPTTASCRCCTTRSMPVPMLSAAMASGRRIVDGRAMKTTGHSKAMAEWNVLLRDHHEGYIDWERFEENQRMLLENAHMKRRAARKSAAAVARCSPAWCGAGRCGRMMRVFYGMRSGHAHRYQCRGDDGHVGSGLCIGIGGIRVDQAVAGKVLEAVSERAVDAAMLAAEQTARPVTTFGGPLGASSRRPATRPRSPSAATSTWIPPSGMSRASSRPGGTRRSSVSSALEQRLGESSRRTTLPAEGRSRGPVAPGPRPAGVWNAAEDGCSREAADHALADRGDRDRSRRRAPTKPCS